MRYCFSHGYLIATVRGEWSHNGSHRVSICGLKCVKYKLIKVINGSRYDSSHHNTIHCVSYWVRFAFHFIGERERRGKNQYSSSVGSERLYEYSRFMLQKKQQVEAVSSSSRIKCGRKSWNFVFAHETRYLLFLQVSHINSTDWGATSHWLK